MLIHPRFIVYSIVGKGNHSVNHVQKLKPRVEQVCRDLGLQYATEENAGRIYVNLTGGPADMPPEQHYQQPQHYGGEYHTTPQHQQPQQQPQQAQQTQAQPEQKDEVEQIVETVLPRVLRKLEKACCVVM